MTQRITLSMAQALVRFLSQQYIAIEQPFVACVLGILNHFMGDNDTVVCAAGSLPGDLQRLWRSKKPGGFH
jgi:TPP-dependent trihydroxycyclohexane-1,2-dione (THcHDO) dehydratase